MTLKFYNGTEYTGVSFTTATEFLTTIRDFLIQAGWSVELDDIDPNLILQMKGVDEDQLTPKDECFIQFFSDTPEEIKCNMYFDDNGTLRTSPNKVFNFYEAEDNRFYLTADSGSGALLTRRQNFNGDGLYQTTGSVDLHPSVRAIHFGFLQRVSFGDKNAIAIGDTDFRLHTCFMQKTFHQNTIWGDVHNTWVNKSLSNDDKAWGINSGTNYSDYPNDYDGASFPSHSTTDFITCTFVSGGRYSDMNDNNGDHRSVPNFGTYRHRNAAYMMFKGNINGVTGLPLLNRFGYIEGHGNGVYYGSQMGSENTFPHQYYFRGWVKFIATGMGSLLPLQQIKESNGDRWISTGRAGFQGMLIDQG